MIILTICTDKPEVELGVYDNDKMLAVENWEAYRTLSDTIFYKLKDLLNNSSKEIGDLEGIVCFKGPGSFTGLRIGLSVGNALSFARSVPIVATNGEGWVQKGTKKLLSGENERVALPEYGAPVHTTEQRK